MKLYHAPADMTKVERRSHFDQAAEYARDLIEQGKHRDSCILTAARVYEIGSAAIRRRLARMGA